MCLLVHSELSNVDFVEKAVALLVVCSLVLTHCTEFIRYASVYQEYLTLSGNELCKCSVGEQLHHASEHRQILLAAHSPSLRCRL